MAQPRPRTIREPVRPAPTALVPVRMIALLFVLPLFATFAFMLVEGWGFFDSLYMSVITLTTVGYHEIHPLSTAGRLVVMVYLVFGLGIFLFGIGYVGEIVLKVQLRELMERKKMEGTIDALNGHIVICGLGRMGQTLCDSLWRSGKSFVVVEREGELVEQVRERGWLAVVGDCTEDSVLQAAGLERASGLAVVLSGDADNLFVVMSARLMNPDLLILARAADPKNVAKLERAGANRVVNVYETGANKMARLLLSPNVEDFMQLLTSRGDILDLAEIGVEQGATYCGQSLAETDFRQRGIIIVGHQKPGHDFVMPPPSSARIEEGDTLIAFGNAKAITDLISRSG